MLCLHTDGHFGKTADHSDHKKRLGIALKDLVYEHSKSERYEIWKGGQILLLQGQQTKGEETIYYVNDSSYYVDHNEVFILPDGIIEEIRSYHERENKLHPLCKHIEGGMIGDVVLRYPKSYYETGEAK